MTPSPRLRRLFRLPWRSRGQIRAEVDEEIRFHLEMRAEELERGGLPPAEARARARREFGDVEAARDALRHDDERRERSRRRADWRDDLAHDLRYALRALQRSPAFAAVAMLTLALGIAASTAIFSVVDGVLLRPAPFPDADRLVVAWETDRTSGTRREPASVPDFLDFRERSTRLGALAGFIPLEANLIPREGEPARLPALAVSAGFAETLGIRPLLGRTFTEAEAGPGGAPVALIGERFWERRYGRDPEVLGSTLRLDDRVLAIVGVVPAAADYGVLHLLRAADYGRSFADRGERAEVELWLPLQPEGPAAERQTHPLFLLGRLADGVPLAAAQREMSDLAAELEAEHPVNRGRGVFLEPLTEVVVGPVRPALLLLLGAVGLVLLIACANVANLLLARGTTRSREIAVRAAMGAGTGRLARQFLVESLVLVLAAGVLGVAMAHGVLHLLLGLAPAEIPHLAEIRIRPRALAATLAVSLLLAGAFGMLPSLHARRLDVQSALRSGARGAGTARDPRRAQSALVVAEVALAVLLLIGAGLLMKSFWRLLNVDPGFSTAQVVKAEYQLPASRYSADFAVWPDWRETHRFNAALLERAAALPGVEAAAIAGSHPLSAGFTNSFVVVGREAEAADWPEISVRQVTPGYFRALGVPLRSGRPLRDADDASAPPVLLINEAAASRFFPGQPPLGQRISFWGAARTIVGVVGDERFRGVAEAAPPAVYLPLAQAPTAGGALLLRLRSDAPPLESAVRAAFREVDPALAVFGVEPLQETLSRSVAHPRFTVLLLGLLAGMALLLALIGVHGVLAYAVAQRTREIGIRMALGASRPAVIRTVMGRGIRLISLGLVLGVSGALLLTRFLRGLLFGVSATDPAIIAGATTLLLAVAVLASYLPARRATRVDPNVALRGD